MIKRCAYCHKHGRRANNLLCDDCKAAGLRWCGRYGGHVVKLYDYMPTQYACFACNRRRLAEARGIPPPDFWSSLDLANHLGYSPIYVVRRLKAGWLPDEDVWQRRRGGPYYVRKRASYPPLKETTRQ